MKKNKEKTLNSILGIGVDIEEVKKFKNLAFSENKNFYKKIFTKKEIKYCLTKSDPYPHFTARFCAKEAFIKAFSVTMKNLLDIEIVFKNKKPEIKTSLCKSKIHISFSHTKNYAIALVILEKYARVNT